MASTKRHVFIPEELSELVTYPVRSKPKYNQKESKNEESAPLPRFTQQEILDLYTKQFDAKVKSYEDQGLVGDFSRDRGKAQISEESSHIFRIVEKKYPDAEKAREEAEELIEGMVTLLTKAIFQEAIVNARKVHTQGKRPPASKDSIQPSLTRENVQIAKEYVQRLAEAAKKGEPLPQEGLQTFRSTYEKLDQAFTYRIEQLDPKKFDNATARLICEVGGLLFGKEGDEEAAKQKAIEVLAL